MSGASRSRAFFTDEGVAGFTHRAFARTMGFDDEDLRRPVIGICNTYSEFNPCHQNLPGLVEAVKRGVLQEGGLPLEFPTISLNDIFMSPTSMVQRNLAAMDTEEMISSQPMDGVVLLTGCDKSTPAALMGAASADIPTIMVSGGPMLDGRWQGERLGACTDCRRFTAEHRAGAIDDATYREVEENVARSAGHCMVMGTASTMNSLTEALGVALPQNGAIPAVDSRRMRLAEHSGRRIVGLVADDVRPSHILTREAFENAITLLCALGGSTNAVVHLPAIAGRVGIDLPLALFDEISRRTPLLANLRPIGTYQMEDFFHAGGVPTVLRQLLPLLHGGTVTVTGRSMAENLAEVADADGDVIATTDAPVRPHGGTAVVTGNLAPDGAVIKYAAATPELLQHRGRAVVFSGLDDLRARIDDPDLDVTADDVLVLQGVGPSGAPGMPEVGNFPLPKKILAQGVRDMVRISDGRMSGTAFGTVVLHVAPESAVGGPLAFVHDGDEIELDLAGRALTLHIPAEELATRRSAWSAPPPRATRGYTRMFIDHVTQAPDGCDFAFLQGATPVGVEAQSKF